MRDQCGIYLYGSSARGDAVAQSDIDILVIVDSSHPIDREVVEIPVGLFDSGVCSDLSFYSVSRIKKMYEEGHLFAWHLHKESRYIAGIDRLSELGYPAEYCGFIDDAGSLFDLLSSIPSNLMKNSRNAVYEAGIAYVCSRNIAMSASYYSSAGLSFSAYAPYFLGYADNPFPLNQQEYEQLRLARLSGTRGMDIPEIDPDALRFQVNCLLDWSRIEIERVKRLLQ